MRLALVLLLALACGKPCPFNCGTNDDCPAFSICYQHSFCQSQCNNLVCSGVCVDAFHACGNCNVQCAAGQVCGAANVCLAACETGYVNCAGSCIDVTTDRFNCGACGHVCGASETCANKACVGACQ